MVVTANRHGKTQQQKAQVLVLWFEDVGMNDVSLVGGKNASLGEMIQQLTPKGINVPGGFATTAYAYRYFIQQARLEPKLRQLFAEFLVKEGIDSISLNLDPVLKTRLHIAEVESKNS